MTIKIRTEELTAALRMKSSSSLFVSMMIPARHFLAVNTKNRLTNADDFIVDLLIETLKTE